MTPLPELGNFDKNSTSQAQNKVKWANVENENSIKLLVWDPKAHKA